MVRKGWFSASYPPAQYASLYTIAAWNFLAWLVGDEAQIEVVAKGGNVLALQTSPTTSTVRLTRAW